ncbi:methionine biosynthesis protein MetW [Balneatrix alpica]|uniref:Methionine biosynthesis protein MetW n=1 Tax=Balneatrix alpica TaxID=75684 RepID=A0ABV5ZA54_9GAMM|nr:methionine biosynthesis protein MetW [Balneatrix alpica]
MRADLDIIQNWIAPSSRVLDLACGDGSLLAHLRQHKGVSGYGLEIDPDKVRACVARGVCVLEHNLDKGLGHFRDNSFDFVIMTQALQTMHRPDKVLEEMLRVGRQCIITFPNFGHWRNRMHLISKGRMPVSKFLPYEWYDTPNIHFCTFRDFEQLCHERQIQICERTVVDSEHRDTWAMRYFPNLLGEIAIYRVTR